MGIIEYVRNISVMLSRKTFAKFGGKAAEQGSVLCKLACLRALPPGTTRERTDIAARINCKKSLQRVICIKNCLGFTHFACYKYLRFKKRLVTLHL